MVAIASWFVDLTLWDEQYMLNLDDRICEAQISNALKALRDANIDVIAMQHQIRNVDVQFVVGVAPSDDAVRVLHRTLVEIDAKETEGRRAA